MTDLFFGPCIFGIIELCTSWWLLLLPASLGTATATTTDVGYDVEPQRHVGQRISVAVGIGGTLWGDVTEEASRRGRGAWNQRRSFFKLRFSESYVELVPARIDWDFPRQAFLSPRKTKNFVVLGHNSSSNTIVKTETSFLLLLRIVLTPRGMKRRAITIQNLVATLHS